MMTRTEMRRLRTRSKTRPHILIIGVRPERRRRRKRILMPIFIRLPHVKFLNELLVFDQVGDFEELPIDIILQ